MPGQGCPEQTVAHHATRRERTKRIAVALLLAILFLCAPGILRAQEPSAPTSIHVRLAWGGTLPRAWQGTMHLSEGKLRFLQPLGLEADSPGSMQLVDENMLRVFPRTPRSYDGCDLEIIAPPTATLTIELEAEGLAPRVPIELPVSQLVAGLSQFDIDDQGNRLLLERVPGDTLRVKLEKDSLVFSPGDRLAMNVAPHALGLAASSTYLLSVAITPARQTDPLTSETHDIKTDAEAQTEGVDLSIPVPDGEGVYDVTLSLFPKRLTSSIVRGAPLAERRVQLIVIDTVADNNRATRNWKLEYDFDPAQPKWWERISRLPSFRLLPGTPQKPISSGDSKTRNHLGRTWVELAPGGWQAYPLSVATPGARHQLEIDFPSDIASTLSISVIEPNSAGQVTPLGLDSGFDVQPLATSAGEIRKHKLTFWPRTKTPWVLVANRRTTPAPFGKLTLSSGEGPLPRLAENSFSSGNRGYYALLEKPLFCENFGAEDALDPVTSRNLEDWQTFYQGATRLVDYLRAHGYQGAVIPILSEGSTIYPSKLLEPTPKYDTGVFFASGQDVVRKDVLELLLRLFDRAGLTLIPALDLSSPLPALETIRLGDPIRAMGIEPRGADELSWIERHGTRRGMGAYYNPLDGRVQKAMVDVVDEIATRYGSHPSLGGLSLGVRDWSYLVVADELTSCDPATLTRFCTDTGVEIPATFATSPAARVELVTGPSRETWLTWRCDQVAILLEQMHAKLAARQPTAKLHLAAHELLQSSLTEQAFRPALPSSSEPIDFLRKLGLDSRRLARSGGIVLPRPQKSLATPAPGHDLQEHLAHHAPLDQLLARSSGGYASIFHEPMPLRLTQFDQQSPFGADKTYTWLVSQISPAGESRRQKMIHAIATQDARTLIEGGWMLPLGQEESLARVMQLFRALPAEPFDTVQPRSGSKNTQPIVVRTLRRGEHLTFYLTNDSPWPLDVEVDFDSTSPLEIVSLDLSQNGVTTRQGNITTWKVRLEPYDLAAGTILSSKASVVTWRTSVPTSVAVMLKDQVRDIRLRVNSLRAAEPREALTNSSFDKPSGGSGIDGWVHATGPGISVAVDGREHYRGGRSLHVISQPPTPGAPAPVVWIRSAPFDPPKTGRISVLAWIRVADAKQQPRLRLAIEGRLDGKTYYRRANVGASEDDRPVKPLQEGWASYRFPVSDLPLSGLTDLRIGFDLMGAGDIWIDEVQVFDLWFEDVERDELLKQTATADFQLQAGQVADCQRFVESYWPLMLKTHMPLQDSQLAARDSIPPGTLPRASDAGSNTSSRPVIPAAPAGSSPPAAPAQGTRGNPPASQATPTTPAPAADPSMLDRIRNLWPKKSWFSSE